MTDFELASLAFQEMAVWAAIVTAVAAAVVGPAQCLLIWKGLRLMERSNGERAAALEQQREADDRRHGEAMTESDRRHTEAMEEGVRRHAEAMEEGARRHAEAMEEGARRHAETMAVLERQSEADDRRHAEAMAAHAEAMATLAAQSRALEALIERTAPAATK